MKNKINGSKKVKLFEYGMLFKIDQFSNIVNYLFNRDLIHLPDKYWIEEDNGWKSYYRKNYNKIFHDFEDLVVNDYKVEVVQ
jgi:hypothetical protein